MGLLRVRPALRHWAEPSLRLAGGGGFAGAYDAIPSIAAAYGMRRLRGAYAGNLLRLRRASDNAEQDFGYDANGDLDVAAIATWLAATTGYVTTWYDQSGNARNAVQTTAANQPLYVASGQNSKPVVRWDGSDDWLSATEINAGVTPEVLIIAKIISYNAQGVLFCSPQTGYFTGTYNADSGNIGGISSNGTLLVSRALALGSFGVIRNYFARDLGTNASQFAVNGSVSTYTLLTSNYVAANLANLDIGRYPAANHYQNAEIAEFVIASAAWSAGNRAAAETAANAYWSIY